MEWQSIESAPPRDADGAGIEALVAGPVGVRIASRFGMLPWGEVGGNVTSLHGTLSEWGFTHWMPLPELPR